MNIKKQVGVWMDYSNAHVLEYKHGFVGKRIIVSGISKKSVKDDERPEGSFIKYYNEIKELIKNYDEILLFGSTGAQAELQDVLLSDEVFTHIQIELKKSVKMADLEQYEFVKKYFSKN